jgi:hypothetical protein
LLTRVCRAHGDQFVRFRCVITGKPRVAAAGEGNRSGNTLRLLGSRVSLQHKNGHMFSSGRGDLPRIIQPQLAAAAFCGGDGIRCNSGTENCVLSFAAGIDCPP